LKIASPVFDGVTEKEIHEMINQARKIDGYGWVKEDGKSRLYDGRTGSRSIRRLSSATFTC